MLSPTSDNLTISLLPFPDCFHLVLLLFSSNRRLIRFTVVSIASSTGTTCDKKIFICAIANGRFFGGGMMVAPEADIKDGLLEAVYFEDIGFLQAAFSLSGQIRSGTHIKNNSNISAEHITSITAKCVVEGETLPLEADGEVVDGDLPATFSVLPAKVSLIVPAAMLA